MFSSYFSEKEQSKNDSKLLRTKIDIDEETALQTKSKILSNKSKDDVIESEPGYSNVDYIISSDSKKKLPYDFNEQSGNSLSKSMEWLKLGSGVSSLFNKNRNRTISCCSCLYCDKYDISNEPDNQTNITTISDAVERDLRKETKPKCASKSICCLVSVLFLIFVSAGAILLYQSRKYFLNFTAHTF